LCIIPKFQLGVALLRTLLHLASLRFESLNELLVTTQFRAHTNEMHYYTLHKSERRRQKLHNPKNKSAKMLRMRFELIPNVLPATYTET